MGEAIRLANRGLGAEFADRRAGVRQLPREVPWYDDFEDGNITGWSGATGYFSVAGGVLKNTLDASFAREIYLSETDADQDLRFDYVRYSSAGTALVQLRYAGGNDRLWLEIQPTQLLLRQVDGGTLTNLATYSTTVSQNTGYSARVELDGASVKVWWGAQGGDFNQVISATTTELTTSRAAMFRANANTEHGWDNVQLIAGTRSTVETFTYNDANEQITQTKNGVTTNMTYDEWGRLEERDDGTHTATYAYRYGSKLYSVTSDFPGEGNVTYETGGDQKRRSRVAGANETWYNWDGDTLRSEEDDADGSSGDLSKTYIGKALAHSVGTVPSSGIWSFYRRDRLGSTRSLWSGTRDSIASLEYSPYGEIFSENGSAESASHRFAGMVHDTRSGMYSTKFRSYSTIASRWISRDPIGMVDGPNLYSYVGGSPVYFSDPTGLAKGTQAECDAIYQKIQNLRKKIKQREEALQNNPLGLPNDCGNCQPGKYRCCKKSHEENLKNHRDALDKQKKKFDDLCRDPNGGLRYPLPEPVPDPELEEQVPEEAPAPQGPILLPPPIIWVPGPPTSSIKKCPVFVKEILY